MSTPALTRQGRAQPVKGNAAFDVILNGRHRERGGLTIGPGQWRCPDRVPVTVERGGRPHLVGWGRVFIDRKGNPRVRGLWATTPLGEYVKSLVAQSVISYANVELEASIDEVGARVYQLLGASFTLPVDPPPAPDNDAASAEPASELLGLAARLYTATPAERAVLADQVIACAVALGGKP